MSRRSVAVVAGVSVFTAIAVFSLVLWNDPWQKLTHAARKGAGRFCGRLSLVDVHDRASDTKVRRSIRTPASAVASTEIRAAAADVIESAVSEHQKATAALLGGSPADAVRRLSTLASEESSAEIWSDYAVALAALAQEGNGTYLFDALAAADRALDIDQSNVFARFNRAVILDQMGLGEAGSIAYGEYLSVDTTSVYAAEARDRIRELRIAAPRVKWSDVLAQIERASAIGDERLIADAALRYPQEVRTSAETEVLGRWGEAVRMGDNVAAEALLSLARRAAIALRASNQEVMLAEAVAAIDRAASDPDRLAILAVAHATYRSGRRLNSARDSARAIESLTRAEKLFERATSPLALIAAYYRASAIVDIGDRRTAVAIIADIEKHAPARYRALNAQVLWLRGTIFGFDGLLGEALDSYEQAAARFDELREMQYAMEMRYRIASLMTVLGRGAEARNMQVALLQLVSTSGDARRLEATLYAAAIDALRERRWGVGYSLLSLVVSTEAVNQRLHAEAMTWRALAAARAGMARRAMVHLVEARTSVQTLSDLALRDTVANDLRLVEALLIASSDRHRAIALLSDHLRVAKAHGHSFRTPEVLLERARLLRADNRPAEAEADLRSAIDLVEARGRTVGNDVIRDAFIDKSSEAYNLLADLLDGRGATEESFIASDRSRARVVLDRIFAGKRDPAGFVLADLDAILPRRSALLTHSLFHDRMVLFVIAGNGLQRFSVPISSVNIEAFARSFSEAVAAGDRARALREGRRLYKVLIGPALPALPSVDSLTIVTESTLHGIPFSALVDDDGHFLVETYDLTIAPSVHVWAGRRKEPAERYPKCVTAIGNPNLDPNRYPTLPPLNYAESEARTIGEMYDDAVVLIREDATRQRVTDALPRCGVVHLGVHAIADATNPSRSRLLLAASPLRHDDDLSVSDISALDLRQVRSIMLAGCDTAVTGDDHGFIRSLSAAFVAAGARNVVASLWEIEDYASRQFSITFHQELREGHAPRIALRRAQLSMLHSRAPELSSVSAWSAMQIYGTD